MFEVHNTISGSERATRQEQFSESVGVVGDTIYFTLQKQDENEIFKIKNMLGINKYHRFKKQGLKV